MSQAQPNIPVFYLLHGAGDCDDSWSSVGRAGFILDNLIAAKKAKPMVVVMPAGHTSASFSMGGGGGMGPMIDEFSQEFNKDILPYIEGNYRVLTDRRNRAMAGLSMGGMQTLNIAISDLGKYAYIGVFSSGIFGSGPAHSCGARCGRAVSSGAIHSRLGAAASCHARQRGIEEGFEAALVRDGFGGLPVEYD